MEWNDDDFRVIFGGTKIEYDDDKEQGNREKHGYSLASAVHFLERYVMPFSESPPFLTRKAPADHGETRHEHITVGDDGEVVFFVTTMREEDDDEGDDDDEEYDVVRVISLRRASREERDVFNYYTGYAKD